MSKAPQWATHLVTADYSGEFTYWWVNEDERIWSHHDSERIFDRFFKGIKWLKEDLPGEVKVRKIVKQLENK